MAIKCRYCKKELDKKQAYAIPDGKSPKYCCNETEHFEQELQKEIVKQNRSDCFKLLCEYMGIKGILPTIANKELEQFASAYSFEIVKKTIQNNKESIEWACRNKDFKNTSAMVKYVLAIIRNKLHDVSIQVKREEDKLKKDRVDVKRINENYVEFENGSVIVPIQTQESKRSKVLDISDFL